MRDERLPWREPAAPGNDRTRVAVDLGDGARSPPVQPGPSREHAAGVARRRELSLPLPAALVRCGWSGGCLATSNKSDRLVAIRQRSLRSAGVLRRWIHDV